MPTRLDDAQILAALNRNWGALDLDRNRALVDRVPEPMRLLHYTRDSVPSEHLVSFGYYHDKIGNIHLDGLPEPTSREFQYAIWRIVELGGRVPCAALGLLTRELAAITRFLDARGAPAASVLDRSPQQWRAELSKTWVRRTGAMPNVNTLRTIAAPLDRVCKLVWFAYDQSPWWRREVWDPVLDKRIPLREHEPFGTQAIHWHRVEPQWLRLGAMWHVKMTLTSGQLRWSTALGRLHGLQRFGRFAAAEGIDHPALCDDPEQLQPLMLRFLEQISVEPATAGRRQG